MLRKNHPVQDDSSYSRIVIFVRLRRAVLPEGRLRSRRLLTVNICGNNRQTWPLILISDT